MTKDEALKELVRLLPALLGEDVVVVPATVMSDIRTEVEALASELDGVQDTVRNASSAAYDARSALENLESYLDDVPDVDDIESRLRHLLDEVDEA
jgi:hypothetical protein